MKNEKQSKLRSPDGDIKEPRARRGALQVHESLREDILWLRIEPGSALDELALAERFKVSRTPIREALLLLSSEGFVRFLPNRTTIVSPHSLDNAGAYFDTLLILSRAVARSAAAGGQAGSEDLLARIDRVSQAIADGDHENALKAHHAFLRHLSSLANNMFQERYFDQILDAGVRMYVLHYFTNATAGELQEAVVRMTELASAISEGDPDRSDSCVSGSIGAEINIITRSLQPQYGYELDINALIAGKGPGHE